MNILTFDIEEWFHILDNEATSTETHWANFEVRIHQNMDRIHNLLNQTNQKATFFCIGWIARKYPEIIKQINDNGHEIASHSDMHQLAYKQSKKAFQDDVEKSIKHLEDIIGKKVISYRAPGFSVKEENKWVFEMLIKFGIEIDCSIFPAKRAHGGFENFGVAVPCWIDIEGMRIKEFPINLSTFLGKSLIFSGGGYFRLLPYHIIKRLTKNSDYVMTYFHPRDFDPTQPMVPGLNYIRKLKSYYGLENALRKLEKLIKEEPFIDLKTADKQVDWTKAKVLEL
jgi:polysaccharide deacetylase family protein (PEP-CTERM system associated)